MNHGLPDQALARLRAIFQNHSAIERVILYGSRAKGTFRPGSDIDLAVTGDVAFEEMLRIENEIDDLLLPWMIDLCRLADVANPALVEHIGRVGVVLYDRSAAYPGA
jgi:predicted nucleotidyltransferase